MENINVVDVIVVILILGSILSAYNVGFIRLVMQKFSFIGGLIIAFLMTSPIATFVADMVNVSGMVTNFVTEHINEANLFSDTAEGHITKGVEHLNNLLDDMSIMGQFAKNALEEMDVVSLINQGYYKDELISMLVDVITVPVMLVINVCVFFVLLLVGIMVCNLLSGIIGGVIESLPLVGTANKVLGGLFGIIGGVAWSIIFVVVYCLLSTLVAGSELINIDMVQSSFVGKIVLDMFSSIGGV